MNIASIVEVKANPKIPDIFPGDTVKVSAKIVEGDRERIQVFQGVVIRLRRGGAGASFTVRHVFHGIGVERTFPFYSPLVEKVEITRQGKVRRAKLYYLRGRSGKASRLKESRRERKGKEEQVLEQPQPSAQVEEQATEQEPEQISEPAEEQAPEAPEKEQP